MCYQTKLTKKKEEIQRQFDARISGLDEFDPSEVIKAFDFPKTPVITDEDPKLIQLYQWGLIPYWADKSWNRQYTLNARIETLEEKPSFKNIMNNRCLIIVNGFYEWQHINGSKIKYDIGFNNELFALAGLYDHWADTKTYTVVTTEAQGVMREIHNTKLRMPFALYDQDEMQAWLTGKDVKPRYDFTTNPGLYQQQSLF
ncbi:SOS response-associated peptidase [Lutimonas zeaxanthinifaciens]|uniref:SOS response-associated peptidase n=1 Tax=Lutimonas zeaxanthinifaciens TaxID=3060215 RepID=UPI00265D238E|nr:SOS response-associated peptidase [Lutimonas sp. YSD2104]WKK64575.1 SOS response-associated peptidase [Lutimonas sp. YSD2104]